MRILDVLASINIVTGGPAVSIPLQLKALVKLGHHVELFTTNWPEFDDGPPERIFDQDGVVVHVFPASKLPFLGHLPYSRGLIDAFREARGRFDIYQVSGLWNPLVTHMMVLCRRYRLPYGIVSHGMLDPLVFAKRRLAKRAWGQIWERANVESAELVLFSSDEEMRKAQSQPWHLRRSLVMPILVDTAAGWNLPPRQDLERAYPQIVGKQVIAFIGRINWVKNLDRLVAALALVAREVPDVVLLCVGPDSDGQREALVHQAAQLGIAEKVIFTGLFERAALKAVYSRADLVALVSQKENFGIAAAEALCAGVPVVLSDGVDMGKEWRAPPVWRVEQTSEAIAQGLLGALAYTRHQGTPSAAARDLAEREWGQSQILRLSEAYEAILAARREHRSAPARTIVSTETT